MYSINYRFQRPGMFYLTMPVIEDSSKNEFKEFEFPDETLLTYFCFEAVFLFYARFSVLVELHMCSFDY